MRAAAGDFDPADLLPDASLNRTVIPELGPFPADLRGALGFDLLGAHALADLPATPTASEEVGRRLAALVAALVVPCASTDGRGLPPSPWRLAYLAHWTDVEEVWLGGGTAARFGSDLAVAATRFLADYGTAVDVRSHDHPALLPLIGAARTVPGEHREAIVLDMGHSWVKRGAAHYKHDGALCAIEVLRPVPVDAARDAPDQVVGFVDAVIDMSLDDCPDATAVRAAVAAYVSPDGVIDDSRSYYAAIGTRRLQRDLTFVHDGTAAALGIDSDRRAAVLTLGTAIGVGFDTKDQRRSIAEVIAIHP